MQSSRVRLGGERETPGAPDRERGGMQPPDEPAASRIAPPRAHVQAWELIPNPRTFELRIPPLIIGLVLGAMMGATARISAVFAFALPAARTIGVGLAIAGLVAGMLGVVAFRGAGTTVNPLQPAAASQLVVSGIYRWTRNPMYLGMLIVLVGWGVFLANALAIALAAALIPVMNHLQIGPEERILAARFGSSFAAYQSAVRRWL